MAKPPAETLLDARRTPETAWHGTAFVVEALVLLVFLAFALAVFMQLFGAAHASGVEERALAQAVALATNDAEEFAAAPGSNSTSTTFDAQGVETAAEDGQAAYLVNREVAVERSASGTLYRAAISVEHGGEVVYALDTARYVSDAAPKGGGAS